MYSLRRSIRSSWEAPEPVHAAVSSTHKGSSETTRRDGPNPAGQALQPHKGSSETLNEFVDDIVDEPVRLLDLGVELLCAPLRPQVVLQTVGHVVDSRQLDRLQPIDEPVRLRRRLPKVRESAHLVDGDRNEVLDPVCLLRCAVRDPERRQVLRLRVAPSVRFVCVLVVGLVAGGGLYENSVGRLAVDDRTNCPNANAEWPR